MTLKRLFDLPWRRSKEQIKWLRNRTHDQRPEVRELAQEQYDLRFQRPDFTEPEFDEPDEFDPDDLDEEDIDELPF